MFKICKDSFAKIVVLSFLLIGLFSSCIDTHKEKLVDQSGNPSKQLLQLLSVLEIKHDGSLQSIVDATQKDWLQAIRPGNKERWEIDAAIKEKFEQQFQTTLHKKEYDSDEFPTNESTLIEYIG